MTNRLRAVFYFSRSLRRPFLFWAAQMSQFVIANNVNTQLATAALSTATTLVLASSANLPTLTGGQMMPLALNDAATGGIYETVYATAISGATLTVLRGQEGTSALNWNVGDFALCGPTAGTVAMVDGNPNNVFFVAPATAPQHAMQMAQAAGVVGSTRNLVMNVTAASSTATLTADEIIVETALGGIRYCLSSFSKTINLATTGAGGMDTGTAPTSGYVALYAIYNPTTATAALLATNAATLQPNVYGGANMPAGYTASALVSVWPTNASKQFVMGYQIDRSPSIAPATALTTSTAQASPTAFSVAGFIPLNARSVRGSISLQSSSANSNLQSVLSGSSGNVGAFNFATVAVLANSGITAPYSDIPIMSPQQMYYTANSGAGTLSFTVLISGYTI